MLATAAGLVLLGLAGWCYGIAQISAQTGRRAGRAVAVAAVLAAVTIMPGIVPVAAEARDSAGSEPFSAARLAELRAQGRPVFVNMTAAWCVTCLVNERIALAPDAVQHAFKEGNVAYLKGDWTRQDPEITDFLHSHSREGVPLYVFYPANKPGEVLPQIITEGEMLQKAKG